MDDPEHPVSSSAPPPPGSDCLLSTSVSEMFWTWYGCLKTRPRTKLHCWASRAFLLAFNFSRRLDRWLLLTSSSSMRSRAERSWKEPYDFNQNRSAQKTNQRRRSHLSLQSPLLHLQLIFNLLSILRRRLVATHLTLKAQHLKTKSVQVQTEGWSNRVEMNRWKHEGSHFAPES